jgi:YHYH protein
MGPWYGNAARTRNFPNFPANENVLYRLPRTPTIPAVKTRTHGGPIGYGVDGVALFDFSDAFSYSTSVGEDSRPMGNFRGDRVWNRDATINEGMTFDPALAHQAGPTYHYHANMPALRHLLGDHVDFDAHTKTYVENKTPATRHSPIVGWMADGHPVYGPYGYASSTDSKSAVRRMISGYIKRDGAHGTTNLAATGRTTLPKWATTAQNRAADLPANVHGPAVNATYVLGHYLEDYDYLGDLGKTHGADFDLDACNGRFCVTPEFPGGTYAYFVSIESEGAPKFPYLIGRWFHGNPAGGSVRAISENVTDYVRTGPNTALAVKATPAANGGALTWNSVEGATYKIESSADSTTWTTLAPAVTSAGATTSYTATNPAKNFRVTLSALATYDTRAVTGTPVGTMATVAFDSALMTR